MEMYKRGVEIRKMIGEGYPLSVIREEIAKQFRITQRAVELQYYSILNEITKVVAEDREQLRAKIMARNEAIYEKSITDRQYRTALDANMAQAKLGGLLEKSDDKSKVPEIIEISARSPLKIVGADGTPEDKEET